jgi:YebC/PmpR family DNA-binding regulatory protein
MAGHSKWANIKHKKARMDSARAKTWNKVLKEITVAAKLGGGDVDANPRLRLAVIKAKASSMPKQNIENAIRKGVGGNDGKDMFELIYEGYGVGGTAFLVKCLTDNKTRTVADVRHIFSKFGGQMGETGSVAWGFKLTGQFIVEKEHISEDALFECVSEAGADDLISEGDVFEVRTGLEAFTDVAKALEEKSVPMLSAELTYLVENNIAVDQEQAEKLQKMIERFEDHDDVQDVYHNIDFGDFEN